MYMYICHTHAHIHICLPSSDLCVSMYLSLVYQLLESGLYPVCSAEVGMALLLPNQLAGIVVMPKSEV